MLPLDPLAPETLRPLFRKEYDRLVDLGVFEDERIELLYGQLVTMSPQGTFHAYVISQLNMILTPALVGRATVRVQSPLAASDISEPEPDLAVYPRGAYLADHPRDAFLVVEVAGDSLQRDRLVKSRLYAECGIPEYWLVDLAAGHVEVRRGPRGHGYRRITQHGRDETLHLHEFPDVTVALAEVLPPPDQKPPSSRRRRRNRT